MHSHYTAKMPQVRRHSHAAHMPASTDAPKDLKKQPSQRRNARHSRRHRHSHAAVACRRMADGRWQWSGSGSKGAAGQRPSQPSSAWEPHPCFLPAAMQQARRQNKFEELFSHAAELEARKRRPVIPSHSSVSPCQEAEQTRSATHDCGAQGPLCSSQYPCRRKHVA